MWLNPLAWEYTRKNSGRTVTQVTRSAFSLVLGFVSCCYCLKSIAIQLLPNEIESVVDTRQISSNEAVKLDAVSSNPELDQESLRGFCREQLTAYKVPRFVEFCDDLPKSNVGKILRRELRD